MCILKDRSKLSSFLVSILMTLFSYQMIYNIFQKITIYISTFFHDWQSRPYGILVKRDHIVWTLCLSQDKYISNLLTKFITKNCNPVNTPLDAKVWYFRDQNVNLTFEQTIFMIIVPYFNVFGSLQYLVTCTQLDLIFFVSHLVQFMVNLAPIHWDALKQIMRYLKKTNLSGILVDTKAKENFGYKFY
jgi:hypothetical protein